MRIVASLLSRVATLALALSQGTPAGATLAFASADGGAALKRCVAAEEGSARAAGGDEGPPKFTRAFYAHSFKLDTSFEGLEGNQLPIEIERVCGVPKRLEKQAAQLSGTDAIALLYASTTVWKGNSQLSGAAATTALDDADTAVLTARLASPRYWGKDEDGDKVPTFVTRRVVITD
jgi:hypothetical protein